MSKRKFILTADGLGLSNDYNKAIAEGYTGGFLKSVGLVANGQAFEEAVNIILPQCPDLGVGIHLNLTKGHPICRDLTSLTNQDGIFCLSYLRHLINAYKPHNESYLEEIEREIRRQIERAMSKTHISHISSIDYIHTIPPIFNIVCRLAKEYGITYIRTHFEKPHIIPDLNKHLCWRYLLNLLKLAYLDILTIFNESMVHQYELKTNDNIIGITYDSMIDGLTIAYGVMAINYENAIVETVIQPCRYADGTVNNNFSQYLITKNNKLKNKIENLGYEITNYVE